VRSLRLLPGDPLLANGSGKGADAGGTADGRETLYRGVLDQSKDNIPATTGLAEILVASRTSTRRRSYTGAHVSWRQGMRDRLVPVRSPWRWTAATRRASVRRMLPLHLDWRKDGPAADTRLSPVDGQCHGLVHPMGRESRRDSCGRRSRQERGRLGRERQKSAPCSGKSTACRFTWTSSAILPSTTRATRGGYSGKPPEPGGPVTKAGSGAGKSRTRSMRRRCRKPKRLRELDGAARLYADERSKEKPSQIGVVALPWADRATSEYLSVPRMGKGGHAYPIQRDQRA